MNACTHWSESFIRRRGPISIVAEILETAKAGALKTHIMYGANLSFKQVGDYLRFLLKTNLLNEVAENNKKKYEVTDNGIVFLQNYHEITELLDTKSDHRHGENVKDHPLPDLLNQVSSCRRE